MSWLGAFAAQRVIAGAGRLRRAGKGAYRPGQAPLPAATDYDAQATASAEPVRAQMHRGAHYFPTEWLYPTDWITRSVRETPGGHPPSPDGNVDDNGVPG